MAVKAKALSEGAAPGEVTLSAATPSGGRSGLAPERVIEIQRSRILSAMVEVSSERGAGDVTVAHVVDHAGVSRRTFYELYSDREACFLGAFDDGLARASRYVLDSYDPAAKWEVRIRTALTALLMFLDEERDTAQLLVVGSLGAGAVALQRRRQVLAQMISLVDEGHTVKRTPSGEHPEGHKQAGKQAKAGAGPPSLTAEGIVGGVVSVLHTRLSDFRSPSNTRGSRGGDAGGDSLLRLIGPLMAMIVLPYLGPAASRRELSKPVPKSVRPSVRSSGDPLKDLQMRLTYRTLRVLLGLGADPGASNRQIGEAAEVSDQGQISKLLARLERLGLVENTVGIRSPGGPNAWALTSLGRAVEQSVREADGRASA